MNKVTINKLLELKLNELIIKVRIKWINNKNKN